ncbi:Telomere_reg-2 domain-containing protein [Pseudozyma hubeiensis]|nr:Telomere_reg-2 domain-containing protein [Pseudozyma hubeiensis]
MIADGEGRRMRREFEAVLEGSKRFETVEEAVRVFAVPFVALFGPEILPPTLLPYASAAASSSSGDAVASTSTSTSVGQPDALLIETVQTALLSRIVVDFPRLPEELFDLCFFLPHTELTTQGLVQQCTLRSITRLLSSNQLHPVMLEHLEKICNSALKKLSLNALVVVAEEERNKARGEVLWKETLRLVTGVPDRIANAGRGQTRVRWGTWVEEVLVRGIVEWLGSGKRGGGRRVRDVVVRLDRLGYVGRAVDADGRGFWRAFLEHSLVHPGAAARWVVVRRRLGRVLRNKLDLTLVETVEYLVKDGGVELVSVLERGKVGTEGKAFLGEATTEKVAAIARILSTLLSSTSSDDQSSDSDSHSDTDDDLASQTISTFETIALHSPTPHSPLLARAWTHHLSTCLPKTTLLRCLESTLSTWADRTRIARSILQHEVFLSTLIVCLLSTVSCSQNEDGDAERLFAIARSLTVLNGVSAHLEHSDATIRRLGMLVAELLSGQTVSKEAGGKVLDFGKGVWDGKGEGREEARVLRCLCDGWRMFEDKVKGKRRRFEDAVRALGVGVEAKADKGEVVKGEVAKARKPKATTRRLPVRVDPPSRGSKGDSRNPSRPLITMLESDDDGGDDPQDAQPTQSSTSTPRLQMFSDPQTTSRHQPSSTSSASSSESSSEDSDSDAVPDTQDPDSIHRIAASLSGLSTDEASRVLASSSTSRPAKPRSSDPSDFTADPESHAPQFTTKTPAPIYISQLSPLLRSSTRSSIRVALHHASALIRRKSHTSVFGAEVTENAVDLTLSLLALHDNFGIKRFEAMRRDALIELVVAEPRAVVGVLTEQCFSAQWSDVQRGAMWCAVGEGAMRLAGAGGQGSGVAGKVDRVVAEVVGKAREVGEEEVAQIRREKSLTVNASRGRLVEVYDASSGVKASEGGGGGGGWMRIAGPVFLFPLLNRLLAYQSHHASLSTQAYRGAGTTSLFQPSTFALLLDTLTLLLSLSPPTTVTQASPLLLELLPVSIDPSISVQTASLLSLLAVLLDRILDAGETRILTQDRQSVDRLRTLLEFTQCVFTSLQGEGGKMGGLQGKVVARAATVLLLMDRVERCREEEVRRLIGFVP